MPTEYPLSGGNSNCVVRVGDSVRRVAQPATTTIQRLLRHVRQQGVHWVPEPLGFDEQGREMLSFLPGEVVQEPPPWFWESTILEQVGQALRQFHDATQSFDTQEALWAFAAVEPQEVICHGDFAAYNCVFRDQKLSGAIDFDTCSPGPRLWDIGYTAYRFIPLMPPRALANSNDVERGFEFSPFSVVELLQRLQVFSRAYAGTSEELLYPPEQIVQFAVRRLEELQQWTEQRAQQVGSNELASHAQMYRAHAAWLREVQLPRV